MRALRVTRFGPPDALQLAGLPDPVADDATAVVRVHAASINPSDVGNLAGRFPQTRPPRTPGRDYAGVVIAGPASWLGAAVWGTGGDLGFTRDGTHAEQLAVPVASLRRKPSTLDFPQAASVGVVFLTAWVGIVAYAGLRAGENLAVVGVTGGVGGAGAQLGRRIGARVIGLARHALSAGSPTEPALDALLTPPAAEAAATVRAATGGRGADVVLDCVGAGMFEQSLAMLAPRGRLVALTSRGQRRVGFDLLDFYHNESRLFGVDSLARDAVAAAEVLDALAPGFADGTLRPPAIDQMLPLEAGVAAYRRVAEGAPGRVVLAPSAPAGQ
jgi:NADPH:quinone reductase-like Zn-dependent oxidoreductase